MTFFEELERLAADKDYPLSYRYRYLREAARAGKGRPLVTICEIYGRRGMLSRGVAFCSLQDNPRRKTGQAIAMGRAVKALEMRQNIAPIDHGGKVFEIRLALWAEYYQESGGYAYKGEYFK